MKTVQTMVFIIDRNDSRLLFPVCSWLPGSERQPGLSNGNNQTIMTVHAFFIAAK